MNRVSDEPCSRKLLLLIEDKPAIATRPSERLAKQADYQVIVASDCLTALKFLRSCTPDLMLVDERLLMQKRGPQFIGNSKADCRPVIRRSLLLSFLAFLFVHTSY